MRLTLALMLLALPLQARPLQAETLSQDIARTNLATAKTAIPATSDLAVKIALDDLRLDVNQPGTRTPDEGLGRSWGNPATHHRRRHPPPAHRPL